MDTYQAEIVVCFTDNDELDFAVIKESEVSEFGVERSIALTGGIYSVRCGDSNTFKGEIIWRRSAKEIIAIYDDYYDIRHGGTPERKAKFDDIASMFTYDFVGNLALKYREIIIENGCLTLEDVVHTPNRMVVLCNNTDEITFAVIITDNIANFGEERRIILPRKRIIRCGNVDECEIVSRNTAKELVTAYRNFHVIHELSPEIKKEYDRIMRLYSWRFVFDFGSNYREKFDSDIIPKLDDILVELPKRKAPPNSAK